MDCLRIIYNRLRNYFSPPIDWYCEKQKFINVLTYLNYDSAYYQIKLKEAKKCMHQIVERLYDEGYWMKTGNKYVQELYAKIYHANMLSDFYKNLSEVSQNDIKKYFDAQIDKLQILISEYKDNITNNFVQHIVDNSVY